MTYGTIKVDTVTFTNAGVDKSVTLSGLVQNPTFSGNVTVTGTLSGVTVTGTTANFTSGNFTNISGGTHTITSGVFAAGSAASPSITFTGDLNTGIYSPGADQVAISTGGSGRLFVDASGRVGIGEAASVNGLLRLNAASGTNSNLIFSENNTDRYLLGQVTGDNAFRVYDLVANTERLRITSAGLVGVGTSTPSYVLDVAGSARVKTGATGTPFIVSTGSDSQGSIRFGSSGGVGVYGIYGGADYTGLQFWTGGVQALTIDNSQRVGVGTTSPSSRLHVLNPSAGPEVSTIERDNSGVFLKLYRNAGSGNQGGLIGADSAGTYFAGGTSTAEMLYIDSGNSVMQFFTSGSERVRIDSSGRVGIGTSSPGVRCEIKGSNVVEPNSISNFLTYGAFRVQTSSSADTKSFAIAGGPSGLVSLQNVNDSSTAGPLAINPFGGNVGIGTSSPSEMLTVTNGNIRINSSSPGNNGLVRFYSSDNAEKLQIFVSTTEAALYTPSPIPLKFQVAGTESARIDTSGRLLVGTSSASGVNSNTAPVLAGNFASFTGSVSANHSTATTLFTLENLNATYMVTAVITGTANAGAYHAVYIVGSVAANSHSIQALKAGSLLTLSLSGANVQATQGSGVAQTVTWSVTRMANL